jgi:protein-S-isoprenylcysteine O-methyltransferase Ste14
LALGSWWGMLVNVLMVAAIIWRLLDEETFLVGKLPGYVNYLESVRYRLAPFVW